MLRKLFGQRTQHTANDDAPPSLQPPSEPSSSERFINESIPASGNKVNTPTSNRPTSGSTGGRVPSATTVSSPAAKLAEAHDLAAELFRRGLAADERGDATSAFRTYSLAMEAADAGLVIKGVAASDPKRQHLQKLKGMFHDRWEILRSQHGKAAGSGAAGRESSTTASTSVELALKKLSAEDRTRVEEMVSLAVDPSGINCHWDDVIGLTKAKQLLFEAVILPQLNPSLFRGMRQPPSAVLLFGPPGTGKTFIAKALAKESNCVFFSIAASTVMSKWLGEGEKIVKAIFFAARLAAARGRSGSERRGEGTAAVLFIDEIDALLSARGSNEHEATRRMKTEFLVQMDGLNSAGSSTDPEGTQQCRVITVAATNRPQDLDTAAIRRFTHRVHIGQPDADARQQLLESATRRLGAEQTSVSITKKEIRRLALDSDGYSNSDLAAVMREAAMMPIRELGSRAVGVSASELRPVRAADVRAAMQSVRPSIDPSEAEQLRRWAAQHAASETGH